jgi:hypothetical protein
MGEHQARINNDWQIDEVDRHRTKINANVEYAYLGNDSPDAVGKTIINLLVFFAFFSTLQTRRRMKWSRT